MKFHLKAEVGTGKPCYAHGGTTMMDDNGFDFHRENAERFFFLCSVLRKPLNVVGRTACGEWTWPTVDAIISLSKLMVLARSSTSVRPSDENYNKLIS